MGEGAPPYLTVTRTVATLDVAPASSFTVYRKLSVPVNRLRGV
jgi:hypothetical protein